MLKTVNHVTVRYDKLKQQEIFLNPEFSKFKFVKTRSFLFFRSFVLFSWGFVGGGVFLFLFCENKADTIREEF